MVELSTKPYLIRAIYEWCADCGYTPYLSVHVDENTRVPMEYVKDGEIVLNIGHGASRNLTISNDIIQFSARFNGVSREIAVPTYAVQGIFARETGKGAFFEVEEAPEQFSMGDKNVPVEPNGKPAPRGLRLASVSPLNGADDTDHPTEEGAPPAASHISSIRTMRSVPNVASVVSSVPSALGVPAEVPHPGAAPKPQNSSDALKFPADAAAKKSAGKQAEKSAPKAATPNIFAPPALNTDRAAPAPASAQKLTDAVKSSKASKLSVSPPQIAPPSDEPPPASPAPADNGGKKGGLRVIK